MSTKRYFTLLAAFFIFHASFAQQQNFLGFKGDKAILQNVEVKFFKNAALESEPDTILRGGFYITAEMRQWGLPMVDSYIHENIRIAANRFFTYTAGAEGEFDVNVTQPQNGEKCGKAIFLCGFGNPLEVDFKYNSKEKILSLQFSFSEQQTEKFASEIERMQQSLDPQEFISFLQNKTLGTYTVSANYLVK
jgi:hypothetical protein